MIFKKPPPLVGDTLLAELRHSRV